MSVMLYIPAQVPCNTMTSCVLFQNHGHSLPFGSKSGLFPADGLRAIFARRHFRCISLIQVPGQKHRSSHLGRQ